MMILNGYFGRMDEKRVMKYSDDDDDDIGYILEVDLDYPKELHDLHKDYPLAPEIMYQWEYAFTSPKGCRQILLRKDASDEKTNKLVLNVMDKKKCVLRISALKFYLQHGLSLRNIHRAISFKQANFLKPFIEFNTEKRKNAKNDFEKDLFKLMNNSVYGKTMENVRKHGDYEIVNTPERFQKLVNKPLFKHRHIINEDLVIVEKDKHTVELNKPIYMDKTLLKFTCIHFTMMC